MKLNKFKAMVSAAALLMTASLTSCMSDLDKGNIDPTVQAEPDITALYSKCYACLILEGMDGNADFKYVTFSMRMCSLLMRVSAGGPMVDWKTMVRMIPSQTATLFDSCTIV